MSIERAVGGGSGRMAAALESMNRFYRHECNRLSIERRMFSEELERRRAAGKDARDILQAIEENRVEQRKMDTGFRSSSLRRAVESATSDRSGIGGMERRTCVATAGGLVLPMQDRAVDTSASAMTAKQFVGYGAVFDKWAVIGGAFKERIARRAFTNALKTSDVRWEFNHSDDAVFGRTSASTLELAEDNVGLRFICYLIPFDSMTYGLARRIDRRDISGCSFSFTVKRDSWTWATGPGELDERIIQEFDTIFDVGAVSWPAYPQTSVEVVFGKADGRAVDPHDDDDSDEQHDQRDARTRLDAMRDRYLFARLREIKGRLQQSRIDGLRRRLAV